MGNTIEFQAVGARVYMITEGRKELFCVMSVRLLTPKSAAEETAAALASHINR